MKDEEVRRILDRLGAVTSGHFLLASGRHSETYMQCARVMERPDAAEPLCRELARRWTESGGERPGVVVGPAMGAVLLAYELARAFGVRDVYAERTAGVFALRRGFSLSAGEKVLLCEDVVTTGGSCQEVMEILRPMGVSILGAVSLVDRGGGSALGVPKYVSLLRVDAPTYDAAGCPACRRGTPLVAPGTRQAGREGAAAK